MKPVELVAILGVGLGVLWIYFVITWMKSIKSNVEEQTKLLREIAEK